MDLQLVLLIPEGVTLLHENNVNPLFMIGDLHYPLFAGIIRDQFSAIISTDLTQTTHRLTFPLSGETNVKYQVATPGQADFDRSRLLGRV